MSTHAGGLRHEVAFKSCFPLETGRKPPVLPGESTGLNKERPGQCTEVLWHGEQTVRNVLSWKPHPGEGQIAGMVNICESVIKIVTCNMPKRLTGMNQNGRWSGTGVATSPVRRRGATGRQRTPNPAYSGKRNVETPYISLSVFLRGKANREGSRRVCGLEMSEEANAGL